MRVRSQFAFDRPLIVGVMESAALVEDSVHLAIFATLHGGGCRMREHNVGCKYESWETAVEGKCRSARCGSRESHD